MKNIEIVIKVVQECLNSLDANQFDDIAFSILLDEQLGDETLQVLEQDDIYSTLLNFIDAFFDAGSHRFPEIIDGISMEQARLVVNEILDFFMNREKKLSDSSMRIIQKYNF